MLFYILYFFVCNICLHMHVRVSLLLLVSVKTKVASVALHFVFRDRISY